MTSRRFTKEPHVGRVVPGQLAALTDGSLSVHRDDTYDHLFGSLLYSYRGRNFTVRLVANKVQMLIAQTE